ncbi:MAG: hypothetical protein RIB03_02685 [Henriciella sp.]|uniref:HD domain-containing protein n=1 Tax=Henriciella sp. TaxID=1968823 RepID=UPI0032EDE409
MSVPGALLEKLKARYGEPQRHYHTWDHITALKRHYHGMAESWHRPEPVLWALYWHDAIYDPTRTDNEELSDVRKEYAFVPEEAFRAGRARILKGLAERADIYFTEEGRARWDAQARRNLARSLSALTG